MATDVWHDPPPRSMPRSQLLVLQNFTLEMFSEPFAGSVAGLLEAYGVGLKVSARVDDELLRATRVSKTSN